MGGTRRWRVVPGVPPGTRAWKLPDLLLPRDVLPLTRQREPHKNESFSLSHPSASGGTPNPTRQRRVPPEKAKREGFHLRVFRGGRVAEISVVMLVARRQAAELADDGDQADHHDEKRPPRRRLGMHGHEDAAAQNRPDDKPSQNCFEKSHAAESSERDASGKRRFCVCGSVRAGLETHHHVWRNQKLPRRAHRPHLPSG